MNLDLLEQPELHSSKLSIVGAGGAVGSSIAYAAMIRASAKEIALYDIDEKRVKAQCQDLADGTQFTKTSLIVGDSDMKVTANSQVVIITAGAAQKPGQTRLDLAGINSKIISGMMPDLVRLSPSAIFVIVTNPADVMTVVAQKTSGLPANRVFSTGTLLDTSRLRQKIGSYVGISLENIHANVVGEHGDSEFPLWSSAEITSIPIRQWRDEQGKIVFTDEVLADIKDQTVNAAYSIIEGKGATNYAIGLSAARLVEAIMGEQGRIFPLSSVLDNYHGISGVALSVPCLVGQDGIKRVLDVPMNDAELAELKKSAATISETVKALGY
ncbi:MAG: L-lactate dehydrogenase [Propionibacteriaceae bacterium]|jgi:L-lactate dehydrogenase|nr:L-lactate dehydrogenase [Propionibacteriaceae bacterium]